MTDQLIDPHCNEVARQLLTELVKIPSLSGQETAATQWLVTRLHQLGFDHAFRDEAGNAVGIMENHQAAGQALPTVILLGHIDTVPGDIPVRLEDGCLFGRGSVDAKGSLATFVMAAARSKPIAGQRLIVIGAVEEEATSSKGARFVAQQYQPDWCIIGEPSSSQAVTLGYKGRWQIEMMLDQPAAHSAGPQTAAAEKAVTWWRQLEAWAQQFNSDKPALFDQVQISLSDINTCHDGLSDRVMARVGLRLPVDFPLDEFQALAKHGDPARQAEIRFFGHELAHKEPSTSPLVQRFNATFRQFGWKPRHKLKTGTSDMNVVAPVWKCPIVAYGPGDSNLDHTPHEHLNLQEYFQAIEFLTAVLNPQSPRNAGKT